MQYSSRYGQIGCRNQKNAPNGRFLIRALGTAICCKVVGLDIPRCAVVRHTEAQFALCVIRGLAALVCNRQPIACLSLLNGRGELALANLHQFFSADGVGKDRLAGTSLGLLLAPFRCNECCPVLVCPRAPTGCISAPR